MFETNLRDERYLPFENSGVISEWNLELPADVRQFDYDTISAVILHIRYIAREAGGLLKREAITNLKTRIEAAQTIGSVRLFSIRHELPTEWAKFKLDQLN
jgi:Tc toxin complex TcA C-terminal TcB-binding domain